MTTTASAPGPEEYASDAEPLLVQTPAGHDEPWVWAPMWHRACGFGPDEFDAVMLNLVRNPNVLSSWLFRADIVAETTAAAAEVAAREPRQPSPPAAFPCFEGFVRADARTLVRRLIPRNTLRDKPMLQTCLFYESVDGSSADADEDDHDHRRLVVYLPHCASPANVPFYHPKVRGVGFLHAWTPATGTGTVSVHFSFFAEAAAEAAEAAHEPDPKRSRPVLARVALHMTNTVCKHGEGQRSGYVKRVHHDQLVPQARVQDRYTRLKEAHARRLVAAWQETTDATKHVFEDLAIAAFLMELWADMYGSPSASSASSASSSSFPGFVDVGCGNGLLVHVLNAEGYRGWGFDARARRSWAQYGNGQQPAAAGAAEDQRPPPLRECLLLPFFLGEADTAPASPTASPAPALHDGRFPPGTFLIANHADELTAWTPVLAALSDCPFLAIPCCSHNLTGAKFRAPPPSKSPKSSKPASASVSVDLASSSTYASFVDWVTGVAEDCGWTVELEMLRIPSTRNVGLVGRTRRSAAAPSLTVEQAWDVIARRGGAHGFADNVAKLISKASHSH